MIINPQTVIQDIVAVRRLRFLLWFELSTSLLYLLNFLGIFLLYVVLLVTALFTPYVLFVLIKENRFGSILIFFFMVVLPYIFILLIFYGYILLTAWLLLPIILIYLFFFLLKYSVDDWLQTYSAHEQLLLQRKESEQRRKEELF